MPFLLLLVLTHACVTTEWKDPGLGIDSPERGAVLTGAAVLFAVAVSAVLSWWARRRLWLAPDQRERVLARYGALRSYFSLGLFGLHGLTVYVFGWGWAVQSFFGAGHPLPPGAEMLVLAPFLTALLGSWFCFYDSERAIHETAHRDLPAHDSGFWTRWQYIAFQVRHNLALAALPVALVILLKAVFAGLGGWYSTAVTVAAVLVCYVLMPWVLRVLLGLRPMPDGPLRQRLLAAAKRLRFRFSDVLLWNTRGGVANALVVGILPWLRYVVFTDRLVAEMTPDEVEAVFGHEIGHVKHWHMPYYLLFIQSSMLAASGLLVLAMLLVPRESRELLSQFLPADDADGVWGWLLTLGGLGTYIFAVFGFISRRCERQADVYGCRAVSCLRGDCVGHDGAAELAPDGRGLCPTGIHTFVNALEKVAFLNGISRRKPGFLQSWQHGSIARRVEFLLRMQADPSLERRFQRRFRLLKTSLLVGLLGVFAVCVGLGCWLSPRIGQDPEQQAVHAASSGPESSLLPRQAERPSD